MGCPRRIEDQHRFMRNSLCTIGTGDVRAREDQDEGRLRMRMQTHFFRTKDRRQKRKRETWHLHVPFVSAEVYPIGQNASALLHALFIHAPATTANCPSAAEVP